MAVKPERIREDEPDAILAWFLRHRVPFRNSRGSFRGTLTTKLDTVRMTLAPLVKATLTVDSHLALCLDEPDYVVWSDYAPIAWHSTTRGIPHRKDVSSHEWVVPTMQRWINKQMERRYNRLVLIVSGLNREKESPTRT